MIRPSTPRRAADGPRRARRPGRPGRRRRRRCSGRNAFSARSVQQKTDSAARCASSTSGRRTGRPSRRRGCARGWGRCPARRWRSRAGPAGVTIRSPVGVVVDQLDHLRAVVAEPGAQVAQHRRLEGLQHAPGPAASVGVEPAQLVGDQLGHRQAVLGGPVGVLELGEHPDRAVVGGAGAGQRRSTSAERQDAEVAVVGGVQRPELGHPLDGAQGAQLGEREVLGEPAGATRRRRRPWWCGGRRTPGAAATSVESESSLSWRTTRTPSRLTTTSGSISSAPRSIASS